MCSREYHATLQAHPAQFVEGTVYLGIQEPFSPREPRLELGNCRRCNSTLSMRVPRCYVPSLDRLRAVAHA